MKKNKLLILSVIVLITINLVLVAFILFRAPHHPKHGGPRNIIIERLQFDNNQIDQYDVFIKKHRSDITSIEEQILTNKNQLYSLLQEEKVDTLKRDSLIALISELHIQIENVNFNHFGEIKSLCTPEQLNDFNLLVNEIAQLFSPHAKPKHH